MASRYEHQISLLLDRFPPLRALVKRIFFYITFISWKLEVKANTYSKGLFADKLCWVEPKKIQYITLGKFDIYDDKGKTIGGDWDRLEKKFEELGVHRSFKEVFIDGKNWKDTIYYRRLLNRVTEGKGRRFKTKSDIDERCKQIESLYQVIKNNGYKTKSMLDQYLDIEDEISVNVGRHGDLLFNNGRHRLSIAKLLNVPKVPVRITVRHPQWQGFRRELSDYVKESGGKLYQPITHPDLCDIPSSHDSEYTFNIIRENLSSQKGRLLDIGAYLGYFCHKFGELGFDCYAVENNWKRAYFLRKLRRAENKNFKIITQSIFEWQDVRNLNFDVVLALNVFHHLLKKETTYFKLIDLLKNLKMREMFFQPHLPDEPQMKNAYKNYTNEEFVDFILQNSQLNEARLIGAEGRRPIYKLY